MESKTRFKAHLQRGSLGIREMCILLRAYAGNPDVEWLKKEVLLRNILGKTSEYHVKDLLGAFKRRFMETAELPPAELVGMAISRLTGEPIKRQILFPYYICSDALVRECYRALVLPKVGETYGKLTASEVIEYLKLLSDEHLELRHWSAYLRLRWSRGLLALLRHFGIMTPAPDTQLKRFWLLPEPFAFFLLWLWEQEGSFRYVRQRDIWTILQLENGKDELLTQGSIRKWWSYERSGDIIHFQPHFSDFKEWLINGLESRDARA